MQHTKQREKFPGRVNERRRKALARIERQLQAGTKPSLQGRPEPLTVEDRKRLHVEADALALLIKSPDQARAVHTKKTPSAIWTAERAAHRRGRIGR